MTRPASQAPLLTASGQRYEEYLDKKLTSVGNLVYSTDTGKGSQGQVHLRFFVETSGMIRDIQIVNPADSVDLNDTSIRILKQTVPLPPVVPQLINTDGVLALERVFVFRNSVAANNLFP